MQIRQMTGSAGAAAGGWVGFGGDAGGGLLAEPDVATEAGQVLVAGLGVPARLLLSGTLPRVHAN
jgi:hypothetical protein